MINRDLYTQRIQMIEKSEKYYSQGYANCVCRAWPCDGIKLEAITLLMFHISKPTWYTGVNFSYRTPCIEENLLIVW